MLVMLLLRKCYQNSMTTEPKATEDRSEVRIRKILVPVDGSEYSLNADQICNKNCKI